jgi:hypothetical protein
MPIPVVSWHEESPQQFTLKPIETTQTSWLQQVHSSGVPGASQPSVKMPGGMFAHCPGSPPSHSSED